MVRIGMVDVTAFGIGRDHDGWNTCAITEEIQGLYVS